MKTLTIGLMLSVALSAQGHPGRTDAEGCHAGKLPRHCSMTHINVSPEFPGRFSSSAV